jgi:hypothetical protein
MGVTSSWNVLNLRTTPFFWDGLDLDEERLSPLSLFVGGIGIIGAARP